MDKAEQPILFCPNCGATGQRNGRRCKECRGLGVASFRRGKILYWHHDISRYSRASSKLTRIFWKIYFVTAVVLGVNFFVWTVFYEYALLSLTIASGGGLADIVFSTKVQIYFWLAVVCFCYAFYLSKIHKPHEGDVEHFDYENKFGGQAVTKWENILQKPYRLRHNMANGFTDEALSVFDKAVELSDRSGYTKLSAVHLFAALLESNRIGNTFIRLGLSPNTIFAQLKKAGLLQPGKPRREAPSIPEEIYAILFAAYESAYEFHQDYVSVTELLTAVVNRSSEIREFLFDINVDEQKLKNVIAWTRVREKLTRHYYAVRHGSSLRSKYGMDRAMTAVATPYLNRLSEDITTRAQMSGVESCVARENEVQEIFHIIDGGQNNVLLAGEYGVGKRTIIEGIAEKMLEGDVPKRLFDKRLVRLSVSNLLSGTTPSGAIERLVRCLDEISRAGNIILYIHNLHELLGVSTGSGDKSMDVASTLAEYLTSGNFLVLATTTAEAYAQNIDNSKLSAVFSKVEIKEMNANQAAEALESKAAYIEHKESVFILYDAVAKAVEFSRRFLRDTTLPGSAMELLTEAAVLARQKRGANSLVTAEDVGMVIAEKTHIPVTAISENESSKLLHLEEEMHHRVMGQNEAVTLVANALRRARAEIRAQSRPIANFLFLGPTGVGKTQLAKTIAEIYFGGTDRMIRLDMSEYQDVKSIYRLIGEPGMKGSGILTEAVRRQQFALLLLDELEKADKDVLNLFLQVMDDGRLTDSTGRVVDFTNIILIATSNAGTQYVSEQIRAGVSKDLIKDRLLHGELKQYFKPEFINRFDGIVLFDPLTKEGIRQIAKVLLQRIGDDLKLKGVRLEISDLALDYFAEVGFDPEFGARPLRRVLQEKVENQLAELILSGKLHRKTTVVIGEGGRIDVVSGGEVRVIKELTS